MEITKSTKKYRGAVLPRELIYVYYVLEKILNFDHKTEV